MIIVTNLCVRFSQLLITSDWRGLTTTRSTWKTVHFVLWLMFSWVSKSLHLNNHATLTHSGDFCYFSDLGERSRFISRDSDHPISALREVTSPCDTSRSSQQSFQIYLDASETQPMATASGKFKSPAEKTFKRHGCVAVLQLDNSDRRQPGSKSQISVESSVPRLQMVLPSCRVRTSCFTEGLPRL